MDKIWIYAWKQRKLHEVAEFNPKSELPNEFEYVDLESVVGTEIISHRTETKESAPSRAQRLAQEGDVFFQTVRPYQRNNYLFPKSDKDYVFSTGYAQLRPYIDATFLMSFLQIDSFVKVVLDNCTGTSYPAINVSDLSNLEIALPNLSEEQKKIGETITGLDKLITFHHRKSNLLDEMQKNAWEQRKVSKMFKVTRGYVLPATDTSDVMNDEMPYPVYSSQTKDNGLMGYYSDYLYEDAITWTTDGANAGTVNFRDGKFYCTNVCGVLLSNEIEVSKSIAEALNNVAKRYVSYVGNPKLMNNVMADIQIAVPISKKEREQISSCFSNLDHLITLHQQKCKQLQIIKKFMLKNMFL